MAWLRNRIGLPDMPTAKLGSARSAKLGPVGVIPEKSTPVPVGVADGGAGTMRNPYGLIRTCGPGRSAALAGRNSRSGPSAVTLDGEVATSRKVEAALGITVAMCQPGIKRLDGVC